MGTLLLLGFLLFTACVCGWIARSKGRNVLAWSALGAVFPMLAFFTLLALNDKKRSAW